jgi:hypothetical protein
MAPLALSLQRFARAAPALKPAVDPSKRLLAAYGCCIAAATAVSAFSLASHAPALVELPALGID